MFVRTPCNPKESSNLGYRTGKWLLSWRQTWVEPMWSAKEPIEMYCCDLICSAYSGRHGQRQDDSIRLCYIPLLH
jgi:hypothetical protein